MTDFIPQLESVKDFLSTGGYVLWVIFFMSLLLWTLIIERYWYLWRVYPLMLSNEIAWWKKRDDKASWFSTNIRAAKISDITSQLNKNLSFIRVLVMLCPMLGLLGTVTGMIQVFEVMAVLGTTNARAMASGVSMATIPTMAGLVTALSGFYFSARLKFHILSARNKFIECITYGGESDAT
ncbi:MAG: MotA/TolQ/ExbB proton channel family protein [Gammaproteobacteria bacterium]|nr:MotA/TolQ/ExbB proton channel family protein [Gammaproteobacteria bacterium]